MAAALMTHSIAIIIIDNVFFIIVVFLFVQVSYSLINLIIQRDAHTPSCQRRILSYIKGMGKFKCGYCTCLLLFFITKPL